MAVLRSRFGGQQADAGGARTADIRAITTGLTR
jgi:hypothetical protein